MNLTEWSKEIHEYAKGKGWWDGETRRPAEIHMLIVSEVAEATEEIRNGKPDLYFHTPTGMVTSQDLAGGCNLYAGTEMQKPEGEAVELADAMIRILDYCGYKGWDIEKIVQAKHDYNKTRPARHGGKKL